MIVQPGQFFSGFRQPAGRFLKLLRRLRLLFRRIGLLNSRLGCLQVGQASLFFTLENNRPSRRTIDEEMITAIFGLCQIPI